MRGASDICADKKAAPKLADVFAYFERLHTGVLAQNAGPMPEFTAASLLPILARNWGALKGDLPPAAERTRELAYVHFEKCLLKGDVPDPADPGVQKALRDITSHATTLLNQRSPKKRGMEMLVGSEGHHPIAEEFFFQEVVKKDPFLNSLFDMWVIAGPWLEGHARKLDGLRGMNDREKKHLAQLCDRRGLKITPGLKFKG